MTPTREATDWAERSLRLVGYHDLLERLAQGAETPRGAELCRSLRPSVTPADALEAQALTVEAEGLLSRHPHLSLGGGRDIRPSVERASRGGILAPEELWAIGRVARAARRTAQLIREDAAAPGAAQQGLPRLLELADRLVPLPHLEQELERCLTESGEVADHASPLLAQLRERIRHLAGQVRERLEAFVRSPATSRFLQEPLVTQRRGRYVVPVRQEHRRHVPGLVHDTSASGQTLFVEPMAVLELNNRLREAEGEEREEVERILRALSREVAGAAPALQANVEVLGALDRALAMARLGADLHGSLPQLTDRPYLVLRGARHPALGPEAVPLDVELGRSFHTLVVSGPNTGGKTVSLKTVGLTAAMAASGMRVPAEEGTVCGVFDHLLVDIGDEQSIEQSLSTFSSHLTAVVAYLERATARSLVLLDELGAGTDPTEGSALGMAILETLHRRGCRTMVTTHLSDLKRFAASREGVESGSVEFDLKTLRPTYRFHLGLPGQSNALLIAERLGLAPEVVALARQYLAPEVRQADAVLREASRLRQRSAEEAQEAQRLRRAAEEDRQAAAAERRRLEEERAQLEAQAVAKAREIVRRARLKTQEAIDALREAQAGRRGAEQAIAAARSALREALPEAPGPAADPEPPLERVVVGQRVRLRGLAQEGRVVEAPDPAGKALVEVGSVRLRLPLAELCAPHGPLAEPFPPSGAVVHGAAAARQEVAPELDLRGLRVEEALDETERYLDRALLAGLERVRLIHGKGTGALRAAVGELLTRHPAVASHRLGGPGEGGDGVTVVELGG